MSARISVPSSVYDSYGGRMAIESENYLVSDQSLRGNQTWVWTNKDKSKQCRGVDHIIGLLGRYPQPIALISAFVRAPPTRTSAERTYALAPTYCAEGDTLRLSAGGQPNTLAAFKFAAV